MVDVMDALVSSSEATVAVGVSVEAHPLPKATVMSRFDNRTN